MALVFTAICVSTLFRFCMSTPLTDVEQQYVLNAHNSIRTAATPSAANMMRIAWSPTLAWQAQHVLDEKIGSSLSAKSSIPSGICGTDCAWQNVVISTNTNVQSVISGWAAEGNSGIHWTQMMYASHDRVGCSKGKHI